MRLGDWRTGGLGVLIALNVLGACGRQPSGPVASAGFRTLPADQVIVGFQQFVTQNGKNQAVLNGDTAYVYEDSSVAKVRRLNLTLYNEQGQVSAKLTADSGNVNTFSRAMIAYGNVVLVTQPEGRRIETEQLHYDPQAHRVWSNVKTVQHHQGGVLTGTGFEADDKFYNVRISNARSSGGGFRIQF